MIKTFNLLSFFIGKTVSEVKKYSEDEVIVTIFSDGSKLIFTTDGEIHGYYKEMN